MFCQGVPKISSDVCGLLLLFSKPCGRGVGYRCIWWHHDSREQLWKRPQGGVDRKLVLRKEREREKERERQRDRERERVSAGIGNGRRRRATITMTTTPTRTHVHRLLLFLSLPPPPSLSPTLSLSLPPPLPRSMLPISRRARSCGACCSPRRRSGGWGTRSLHEKSQRSSLSPSLSLSTTTHKASKPHKETCGQHTTKDGRTTQSKQHQARKDGQTMDNDNRWTSDGQTMDEHTNPYGLPHGHPL